MTKSRPRAEHSNVLTYTIQCDFAPQRGIINVIHLILLGLISVICMRLHTRAAHISQNANISKNYTAKQPKHRAHTHIDDEMNDAGCFGGGVFLVFHRGDTDRQPANADTANMCTCVLCCLEFLILLCVSHSLSVCVYPNQNHHASPLVFAHRKEHTFIAYIEEAAGWRCEGGGLR